MAIPIDSVIKTVEHFKKHGRVVTLGSLAYRSGFRPGDVDAVSENTIDTENRKDVWQLNIVRTGKFSVKDNHQSGFDPHWHKLFPELRQQTVVFGGRIRWQ